MAGYSYDTNPQPVNPGETSGKGGMGQFLIGAFFVMFFVFGVWAIVPEGTVNKPRVQEIHNESSANIKK